MDLPIATVKSSEEALTHFLNSPPDWIVFGKGFTHLAGIPDGTKTAMVNHGAGIKVAGYRDHYNQMDVRFVEGPHHLEALRAEYPDRNFVLTGFSKLDPIIRGEQSPLNLAQCGLDPDKPVVLYAPTFYPSSIELMPIDLPMQLAELNLVVKPHYFTHAKKKYRRQRKFLESWNREANVYVAPVKDYSLLPYLASASVLVSEASTTLFEAAVVDVPIVWCDFVKLRWSYRGPFRYRYLRRLDPRMKKYYDIAEHVAEPGDVVAAIKRQLADRQLYAAKRKAYGEELLGPCDGQASQRIADYLLENCPVRLAKNS
ncbi:MAG: CDP-glycerol glycerophosphotransferase family protein [Pseudomonadota bacterium]